MRFLYAVLVLIIAAAVWYALQPASAPVLPGPIETPEVPQEPQAEVVWHNATENDIVVVRPRPNATVARSFEVSGSARGGWYFEASFPIQVRVDGVGILFEAPVQANGEWMTSDFVPFSTHITVPGTYTGPATLILHRDNASGLPEHDKSLEIPIVIR